MELLNLDKVIPDDKELILNGKTLVIPGELPIRKVLEMNKWGQRIIKDTMDAEATEKSMECLFGILSMRKGNQVTREEVLDLSPQQYQAIMAFIFSQDKTSPEMTEKKT